MKHLQQPNNVAFLKSLNVLSKKFVQSEVVTSKKG